MTAGVEAVDIMSGSGMAASVKALPNLNVARVGATMWLSKGGILNVAGGVGADGEVVSSAENLDITFGLADSWTMKAEDASLFRRAFASAINPTSAATTVSAEPKLLRAGSAKGKRTSWFSTQKFEDEEDDDGAIGLLIGGLDTEFGNSSDEIIQVRRIRTTLDVRCSSSSTTTSL